MPDSSAKTTSGPPSARRGQCPLNIIVVGYLVRGPLGGLAWHYLQYVLGLTQLGHRVFFLEDSDGYESCYDPSRDAMVSDPAYGLRFAKMAFSRLGLPDCWAYYDAHRQEWLGPAAGRVRDVINAADLLINVSGVTLIRNGLENVPTRALIDTDPAFSQIRHLTDSKAAELARRHNAFFSFGENIGKPNCLVPDDGLPWQPTRQPVVMDRWPVTPGPSNGPFSTVMQWDSYAAIDYQGRRYGMKSDSFQPYLALPKFCRRQFELAVGSATVPKKELRRHGWRVTNPLRPTTDPWTYQDFIGESRAEFAVAKHGYVITRPAWFSERSTSYLASGRPVIVQNTGFGDFLPLGEGLLAFHDVASALEAIENVEADYERHCRAAREIADAHFGAKQVLSSLVERALDASATPPVRVPN